MKTIGILLIHAFVGWVFCAATMSIGIALATIDTALYIHAALAPVFFIAVSWNYFMKHNRVSPIGTAAAFVAFVIVVDFFVVALLINRSLEMFSNILGTWIPFALIFASTYTTGKLATRRRNTQS